MSQKPQNPDACKDCGETYEDELRYGLCEDCLAEFQLHDLESQIDKAMHFYEPQEPKP